MQTGKPVKAAEAEIVGIFGAVKIFAAVKMWHLNIWRIANVIADQTLTRQLCLGFFWPLSQIVRTIEALQCKVYIYKL